METIRNFPNGFSAKLFCDNCGEYLEFISLFDKRGYEEKKYASYTKFLGKCVCSNCVKELVDLAKKDSNLIGARSID